MLDKLKEPLQKSGLTLLHLLLVHLDGKICFCDL